MNMPKKKKKKTKSVMPQKILLLLLLVFAVIYAGGVFYYNTHFLRGTVIDQIKVSNMTVQKLAEEIQEYSLQITEYGSDGSSLEESITGKEISLSYSSKEPLEEILKEQNKWLWFLPAGDSYETEELITYDKAALEEQVLQLKGFQEDFFVSPTDAHISEYTPENGFEIIPETEGNELDYELTLKTISSAVDSLTNQIDLKQENCYLKPQITSDDERLQETLEKIQTYTGVTITYTFGNNTETLDGSVISSWITADGLEAELNQEKVEEYVASLRKKYDTIFRSRTFMTSYGKEITIDSGDYGWWMNYTQEALELAEMIKNGESGERTPVYYQTAASYEKPDYGTTYVEINLTAQHLFYYQDGTLILESDFVSGNSARGYDTPDGVYSITYKQRNATLTGENYETPVSYWMPFNGNIGMHDASWRNTFGGDIYKTNGSHGCINLPVSVAQELYGYVEKGTPVICYYLPGTEPVTEDPAAPGAETAPESAE